MGTELIDGARSPDEAHLQNWVDIADVDPAEIPLTPWLIENLLLYRALTLVAGKGGAGKSLLMWTIAIMVAAGVGYGPWQAPERRRRVLVLSAEDDVDEIRRRVVVACQIMGLSLRDIAGWFYVRGAAGSIHLVKRSGDGVIAPTPLWKEVRWMVRNHDIGLVIIDPAIKASTGFNESDNSDMEAVQLRIRDVTKGADCALLMADHARKGDGGGRDSTRGASAKVDDARVACELRPLTESEYKELKTQRPKDSLVLFRSFKINYGARGAHVFEFIDRDVGNGERRAALAYRSTSELQDAFLDPDECPFRDELLTLIAEGRLHGANAGEPWCASERARREARLDVAMVERFDLTEKAARDWLRTFEAHGVIQQEDWTSPNRNRQTVWRVAKTEDETGTF